LILPDALKLMPIYVLSLFKQDLLRLGNDVRPADRIYELFKIMTAGCSDIATFLYPKLYPIHTIATNESEFTV
jgi:protein transport protein SEC24